MTPATYENAQAAFRIGRLHVKQNQPSEEDQWDNPALALAYRQGRESVETIRR